MCFILGFKGGVYIDAVALDKLTHLVKSGSFI
jgi:hypothetical protein